MINILRPILVYSVLYSLILYPVLIFGIQYIILNNLHYISLKSIFTKVFFIFFLTAISLYLILFVKNPWICNRLMHAIGGGVIASFVYFLVMRDLIIKKFLNLRVIQFFVLGFLIVTALGVANEILELILQLTTHMVFANTIDDTWLDLSSNTIGIVLALIPLSFLYKNYKK